MTTAATTATHLRIPAALVRAVTAIRAFPRGAALVAGVVSATGFAPLSLWPLTLAAYALLIQLIADAASAKRAFLIGGLFGVGQFTLGNDWIATAFTYQAAMPAWLGWVAVVALAVYLAVYPALATLAAWWLTKKPLPFRGGVGVGPLVGISHILVFASLWIVTEWLRSWVFTGFVWNPLGVAMVAPGLAAPSRWVGTYGLGGLVVILSGSLLLLVQMRVRAALLLFASVFALWAITTATSGGSISAPPQHVTIVQPDIPQETKADPSFDALNWGKLAALSVRDDGTPPRLLLWPEAAIPDFLEPGYPLRFYDMVNLGGSSPLAARRRLAALLGPDDVLVTGTADLEVRADAAGLAQVVGARNSVTVLTPGARVVGSYDKAHLVPYGEYLPMRPLLSAIGLSRLVPGDFDFWPGPGARTIDLGAGSEGRFGKMGVQICYEMIFSGRVVDRADRPDFVFNPSNDAWFGASGPPQHFAQARLRAIEEGLPVIRSTPTGVSGIIDADGRVIQRLDQGQAGRIDALIPPPHAPTFFARHGNVVPNIFALLLLLAGGVLNFHSTRHRSETPESKTP